MQTTQKKSWFLTVILKNSLCHTTLILIQHIFHQKTEMVVWLWCLRTLTQTLDCCYRTDSSYRLMTLPYIPIGTQELNFQVQRRFSRNLPSGTCSEPTLRTHIISGNKGDIYNHCHVDIGAAFRVSHERHGEVHTKKHVCVTCNGEHTALTLRIHVCCLCHPSCVKQIETWNKYVDCCLVCWA